MSPAEPSAPAWFQVALGILGALGGLTGVTAVATVLIQRRKIKAESGNLSASAAETITDTALLLVEPLRKRVSELESEMVVYREQSGGLKNDLDELSTTAKEVINLMLFWRRSILTPSMTIEAARVMVTEVPALVRNGAKLTTTDRGE